MTRPGFAFSTRFRVRYAEIDGQKVVFNSRYLEYADVAVSEFWDWAGIADALGPALTETEFHVRHTEIDYLRPFTYGDTIEAFGATLIRIDGHIGDAGKMAIAYAAESGYFNISTLREPYRVEGMKTMGIELAEQLKT